MDNFMSNLSQFKQGGLWFRGAYAGGVTYYRNNIVTYNNFTYICLTQSTGNLPTDSAFWSILTGAPDVSVATSGSGTTPASFTLSSDGSTITLNKPS
jgi:hypothetical protein